MPAESIPSGTLDLQFIEQLQEAFIALSKGDFGARLERTGQRDSHDSIAYLFNLMAEEIGDLFSMRTRYRKRMEEIIATVTDVLVRIGSGEFDARVERTFDGSPEDVLAYLVNNAAEEVQGLFAELEHKNSLLEEQSKRQAVAERIAYTTLSAGVGHELNNPLTYVSGNLEYIATELQDMRAMDDSRIQALYEAVVDAREGVARAARIANDLKKLAPSVEMVFTECEVEELVETALALIRNTVNHRAQLLCEYEPNLWIRADRGRVGQVLVNLVQNALHALPPERSMNDNRIEIRATRHSGRMVCIEVRDNGEGISPENLSRIFDSFFTTRPVGKGTGLGLALAKRMIADHGGRIEVESELGSGACFKLLLPAAKGVSA